MKLFKNQQLNEADLIPSVLQIAPAMKTTAKNAREFQQHLVIFTTDKLVVRQTAQAALGLC